VHISKGFWNSNGGYEYPLANIAASLAIAGSGAGAYSVDAIAPVPILSDPHVAWLIVVVSVLGALLTLAVRRAPKPVSAS
jgi:putative oxidoreductase